MPQIGGNTTLPLAPQLSPVDDLRSRLERHLSDSYRIERELGGGGMSRTYLAFEHALSRRVVIKVLAPELLAGISVERFRREVLLAAQLQHPHVVPVLSAGDAEGLPWFTMPYVDGDSLRHRLAGDTLGIGETISILRDVARALAYAHRHGIVHRDIKPDNVLLSGGSATVTDFGIAKAIAASRTDGGNGRSTLTQVGTSIGTPTYMSPEQAVGDTGTDHRSDIYAFGIMAYELLAGAPPFRGDSAHKLIAAHLSEKPRDIMELRPDAPPMLAELVMQCLAKDPSQRPQHATDLARVLETITSSASTASAPAILRGGHLSTTKALTLWTAVTALVALTAWAATSVIGLPDWVFPGALGVMIAGLPVILFTAYAQRTARRSFTSTNPSSNARRPQGTMATIAIRASPHLTWRKTWLGGSVAVGAFAALVIGFMVMRASGVGPFATLRSKGAFGERERLIIADFRSNADSALGATLAEALRSDLAQSRAFVIPTHTALREVMRLMQRPPEAPLDFDASREIATREGVKAVLGGDVLRVGQRYTVSARLVNALNGEEFATFREEADSENDLLPAMGRLARAIREEAGEPLRAVRASAAMERVTTSSLPALRKYVEGSRLYDAGEADRAEPLLREAVAMDSGFAMAWRRLAVVVKFRGLSRQEEIHALEQAYRHRERLSDAERLMTEGSYFYFGPVQDPDRAIRAYEQLLAIDSGNVVAISSLGSLEFARQNYERAEEWYRQGTLVTTGGGATSFLNLVRLQLLNGRPAKVLDSTVAEFRKRFPDNGRLWLAETWAAIAGRDLNRADSIARAVHTRSRNLTDRRMASGTIEDIAMIRGRYAEGYQWRARYTGALIEGAPTFLNRFQLAVDSAEYAFLLGENPERVRRLIAQGMARTPLDSMPPSERPYLDLMTLASDIDDPQLMQTSVRGFLRDQAPQHSDSAGARMYGEGLLAYSRRDWDAAISAFHGAVARGVMPRSQYNVLVGISHDRAGRADSAIAYIEQFVQKSPDLLARGRYEARLHRRAAELYEAKGDTKKALEHYNAVLEMWRNAEPSMRGEVDAVRQSMERLRARTG